MHKRSSRVPGFLVVSALAAGVALVGLVRLAAQSATHTVFVSVTDKTNKPITDMQAADFEVKEGGKNAEIVSAKESTTPLRLNLLVADQGTGGFQNGSLQFLQKLLGRGEFAITGIVVQPEKLVDYTSNTDALSEALRKLGGRGRQAGAQLMEALQDAMKDLRSEGKRSVLVVMRVGGEAPSTISGDSLREQLRKSGATLYVVSIAGADKAAPSQVTGSDAVSVAQGQLKNDEMTSGALALGQILGDGSKESGGRNEQIVSTTMVPVMEGIADELLHQYEVSYTVSAQSKPGDKLQVSSKRKNVIVRAPSRLSN
jgi:VWFA-related protein